MDWGDLLLDPRHPSYPLVRGIVADLRRDYDRWCDAVRAYEVAVLDTTPEAYDVTEALAAEVLALAVDIQSYVAEINYLGVAFDVRRLFIHEEGGGR